jgi:hypothetical protein
MLQYGGEHHLIFSAAPLFSIASLIFSCTPKSTDTQFSEFIPVLGAMGKSGPLSDSSDQH